MCEEFDSHLERDSDGTIRGKTDVGKYIVKTFKFNSRPIKEIWNAMQLYEKQQILLQQASSNSDLAIITNELNKFMEDFFNTKE